MPKTYPEAQNPLILRCHRLMEAFTKADDERDFFLDTVEGFILFVDLGKSEEELEALYQKIKEQEERYLPIPKLTFFESKKIMEGFVHEKVYDIDTKEKLLDVIQSKDARENFLDFLYDQHAELEKWQQYYQERSRVRIIEWLRTFKLQFVFEEDLDLTPSMIDKLKQHLFETKAPKEVLAARKTLFAKAKTYYSNEALNPRPKRGRPPKQVVKQEIEPQFSSDIFTEVPQAMRPFVFKPEVNISNTVSFSEKFDSEQDILAHKKAQEKPHQDPQLESLNKKLASLRSISSKWLTEEEKGTPASLVQEKPTVKTTAPSKSEKKQKVEKKKEAATKKKEPKKEAKKRIIPTKKEPSKAASGKATSPKKKKLKPLKKIIPKKSQS